MIIGAIVLILLLVTALLVYLRRESKRQALLLERMRTTQAFQAVIPILRQCASKYVERVEIRPEAVRITLFQPPRQVVSCAFEQHDLDPLDPVPLEALAQLVTAELPGLGDNRRYFFKLHRERVGDSQVRWYEYMIQPDYKSRVMRTAYDKTMAD